MRVSEQLPHVLAVRWTSDGGEVFEEWAIDCMYRPDDYDKPCRIWASEDDHTGESVPGCWVQQTLDEGIECLGIHIPARSFGPWHVFVTGSGDDGPMLTDVSLVKR